VSTNHHHADGQVWLAAAESSVDRQSRVSSGVHWKRVVRVSRIFSQVFYAQCTARVDNYIGDMTPMPKFKPIIMPMGRFGSREGSPAGRSETICETGRF